MLRLQHLWGFLIAFLVKNNQFRMAALRQINLGRQKKN